MNERAVDAIWKAEGPNLWPTAPDPMSVSRLLEIEACPRRWALGAAGYESIWQRSGYPQRVSKAALLGQVVHTALETITKALTQAGCPSVRDPLFITTMRQLGGFTQVVSQGIDQAMDRQTNNPRVARNQEALRAFLHMKLPELRERVQLLTSRLRLQPKQTVLHTTGSTPAKRLPLGTGSYAEVELRVDALGWVGIADLLNVSDSACEIVDFKTGEPKPEHQFQLHVYSLLWVRDTALNPSGRMVDKLTLSYSDHDMDVEPLSRSRLDEFEQRLQERTQLAKDSVQQIPPPAKPSLQNCRFCSVRQICSDYWQPGTQQQLGQERAYEGALVSGSFLDAEVEITEQRGPSCWDAIVLVSSTLPLQSRILLRPSETDVVHPQILRKGKRVRIIDGSTTNTIEDSSFLPFITLSRWSEVFLA